MASGSQASEARCPQCRAPLADAHKEQGDTALHICTFCDTVVVRRAGELKITGRKHESDKDVDWLHAICCRLCGGSLSKEAAAAAEKAKCGYCGHKALLKPGLITVLRVLFTDPKLLPPALRNRVLFSISIVLATIAMTAFMVIQESGPRIEKFSVDASKLEVGDIAYDKVIDVPGFARSLRVEADRVEELEGVGLDYLFVHMDSRSCFVPGARRQSSFYGARNGAIPSGESRLVARVSSLPDPGSMGPGADESALFYVSCYHVLPLGYLIFALNFLLWLSVAVVKFGVDFQSTKRRAARVTQAVTLLFVAYWFCITVLLYNPFGPRRFSPDDTNSYSEHGLACEEVLQNGSVTPPNTELIAVMDQAVALTVKSRADEWQELAASIKTPPEFSGEAPCQPNEEYVLNEYRVDKITVEDFQALEANWMPEKSEKMIIARRIAEWKGRLADDETPEQSLSRARALATKVDLNDHAVFIMEPPTPPHPEEDPEMKPNPLRRSGRLFVWSYQQARLICATPPTWVEDPAKPELEEAIGELRALPAAAHEAR